MPRSATLTLAVAVTLVVSACSDQSLTSPERDPAGLSPLPGAPLASANTSCHYTPDGEFVHITTGTVQTFIPSSTTDCNGAFLEMVYPPAHSGAAGFFPNATNDCALKTWTTSGSTLFKVRKCTSGPTRVNIYTNSSKTTLIQTIGIDLL